MNIMLEEVIDALAAHLDARSTTTEYALITHCKDAAIAPFDQLDLKHSHQLFCAHFLTRHALYTLQNRYLAQGRYVLHIGVKDIERHPYYSPDHQGQAELLKSDPVKAYYLDFTHYFDTSEDEVNALLSGFWQRFLAADERSEALDVLGLSADASYDAIKQRFRQLAQQHHPDKGGNVTEFQRIQRAKQLLDRCYQAPPSSV